MYARITVLGNVGKAPEMRETHGGTAVLKFSVAANKSFKKSNGDWDQKTTWLNVQLFGKLAERTDKWLDKGTRVLIEGEFEMDEWENRDGDTVRTPQVTGNRCLNLSPRDEDDDRGSRKKKRRSRDDDDDDDRQASAPKPRRR
jgi:single-strand DNA-binding protein